VYRNISENDKRQYRFTLTEKGRHVTYETKKRMDQSICDIISRFGEDRTVIFTQMLNDFAGIITQMHDEYKN